MNIYLASKYKRRLEMVSVMVELNSLGHNVCARWINGQHERPMEGETEFEFQSRVADEDINDINNCKLLVLFSEEPYSTRDRGGRHTELGIAIALKKYVAVIGPRENVFHYLPMVNYFENKEEFFDAIKEEGSCYLWKTM